MNKKMTQQEKFDLIVNEVNSLIPEEARDECEVLINEVVKNNDTRLHGIMIKYPGRNVFPTLYLEDLAEALDEGADVSEIAYHVLAMSLLRAPESCIIEDFSYDNIKQNLRAFVLEKRRNKDRLADIVSRDADCGFALMACIVAQDDDGGILRLPVTTDLARENCYDNEEVLDRALSNTMTEFEPRLSSLLNMSPMAPTTYSCLTENPEDENYRLDDNDMMYVLSNQHFFHGATVLFYPDIRARLADIFGENYYILPSSIHETIIIPASKSPDTDNLRKMVLNANRDAVDPIDILSDRVFMYDRNSGLMVAV